MMDVPDLLNFSPAVPELPEFPIPGWAIPDATFS